MEDASSIKERFASPKSLKQAFEFWVKSKAPARQVFRDFTAESKEIRVSQKVTGKRTK